MQLHCSILGLLACSVCEGLGKDSEIGLRGISLLITYLASPSSPKGVSLAISALFDTLFHSETMQKALSEATVSTSSGAQSLPALFVIVKLLGDAKVVDQETLLIILHTLVLAAQSKVRSLNEQLVFSGAAGKRCLWSGTPQAIWG